jgi:aspartate/methionine/tyrosine aminotransferase
MRELLSLADDEAQTLWESLSLGYTEAVGHRLLRREIAALYRLTAEEVLVFSGAQDAIYAWARSSLQPGDHVVCVWPAYQSLFEVARAQGCQVDLLSLDDGRGGFAFDVDKLHRLLRPNTRAVVINTPHNPTGVQLTETQLKAVVEACRARRATLLCDEVYRFLEPKDDATLPGAASLGDGAVSIGALSKSFGLAGLRIGWIASRDRALLSRVAAYKDYTSICASAPSEVLAMIALRNRQGMAARNRAIVRDNTAHMHSFVTAHAEQVSWCPPQAGAVALARLLGEPDADAFVERAAREHGVLLMPGRVFGRPGPEFRVGLGRRNFAEGLPRLAAALTRR